MDDRSTIKAIDSLSKKFPYAAAVLIYIQIERLLKNHILKNRKSGGVFNYTKKISIRGNGKKCVNDYRGLTKSAFIEEFLNKIELGKLEIIFGISNKDISKRRNNLMHSNKYIAFENMSSYSQRTEINREYVVQAKRDLKYIQGQLN